MPDNVYRGTIEEIIYRNDDNGFTVAILETADTIYTVVGSLLEIEKGDDVEIIGEYTYHKQYGDQVKVQSCIKVLPTEEDKIIKFLSSSNIKSVGPKLAERIVKHFGSATLDIMQFNIERLLEVEGIGSSKLEKIRESYAKTIGMRDSIIFLQGLSLGPKTIAKIIAAYGSKTVKVIKDNPYLLYEQFEGIGFDKCDEIAVQLGYDLGSKFRIRAFINHTIYEKSMGGHSFIMKSELLRDVSNQLSIEETEVLSGIQALEMMGSIVVEEDKVYRIALFEAEHMIAEKLIGMLKEGKHHPVDVKKQVRAFENGEKIMLSDMQREAIYSVFKEKVTVITGGPGTGKTTLIKAVTHICNEQKLRLALAAPTGRAAKRMEQSTRHEAKTIHRLLEYQFSEDDNLLTFGRNEANELEEDVVVIDEVSMIDTYLMRSLVDALKHDSIIVFIGDSDQLPSVGPGRVLGDLIDSGVFKVTRLRDIYRQSESSLIPINAERVKNGEDLLSANRDGDFFYMKDFNQRSSSNRIKELVSKRLPDFYGFDPVWDIQVISPVKRGILGTRELNASLQEVINPMDGFKDEILIGMKKLRTHDKVMQMKNNYNMEWMDIETLDKGKGVFNGDIGEITSIDKKDRSLTIVFDKTRETQYNFEDIGDIELAYAITIHKSQGSEFRAVVIPLGFVPESLVSRNLLYTAITRGKELVVILGSENALYGMIRSEHSERRYSSLGERLIFYRNR